MAQNVTTTLKTCKPPQKNRRHVVRNGVAPMLKRFTANGSMRAVEVLDRSPLLVLEGAL